jgi:predicted MFS family arabinose efflux permease
MTRLAVQSRMFLGISLFMALIGVVYWFASYEPAGTTMLGLSSALAAVCGVYLQIQNEHTDAEHDQEEEHYLPHSSVWPFGIGVGAVLAVNGLIVGVGYAIPGLVVLAVAIAGLISQSRRRA